MTNFEPLTALIDRQALDRKGEFVGWVREFLVDVVEGRIEYVRIEFASSEDESNGGAELVVPWSIVSFDGPVAEERGIRLAASRTTLALLAGA